MRHERVDQARIHLQSQIAKDIVVQPTSPIELRYPLTVEPKVSQPVCAFTLSSDWIRQSLFVPQAIGENLSIEFLDHRWNRRRDLVRIASVAVRIEDEQTFVNVLVPKRCS